MKQTVLLEMSRDELQVLMIDSVNACLKAMQLKDRHAEVNNQERYLNKKDAAKIAGVCPSTIDGWGRSKKITRHYFGGSVRFWLPELLEFLRAQRAQDYTFKQSK